MDRHELLERNAQRIEQFRSNGGKLPEGAQLLLLTTKGVKTGLTRTSPLMFLADDDDPHAVYIFGSNGGEDAHPLWFKNLFAHPEEARVELGSDTYRVQPSVIDEPFRSQVYDVHARRYPNFADYQTNTSRKIPVIRLQLERI